MSDDKKLTREEIAAELEAKAKALRDKVISDEDVEKMSAGCSACCGGCQVLTYNCMTERLGACYDACVSSSPN